MAFEELIASAIRRSSLPAIFAPLEPFQAAPVAACLGLAAFAVGLLVAFDFYSQRRIRSAAGQNAILEQLSCGTNSILMKFTRHSLRVTQGTMATFANGFDTLHQMLIRAVQGTTELTGRGLRLLQTGNLQTYTFLFAAGIALVLYLMLLR